MGAKPTTPMIDLRNRLLEERQFVDFNAEKLERNLRLRWDSCKSTHRFQAFANKQLVIYKLTSLRPVIQDNLICRDLDVSLEYGLESYWESKASGTMHVISDVPTEVAPSCFLWMLKYSSLEMSLHKGQKSLRFPLAYKTKVNPEVRVDGNFYILEKAVFENTQF